MLCNALCAEKLPVICTEKFDIFLWMLIAFKASNFDLLHRHIFTIVESVFHHFNNDTVLLLTNTAHDLLLRRLNLLIFPNLNAHLMPTPQSNWERAILLNPDLLNVLSLLIKFAASPNLVIKFAARRQFLMTLLICYGLWIIRR